MALRLPALLSLSGLPGGRAQLLRQRRQHLLQEGLLKTSATARNGLCAIFLTKTWAKDTSEFSSRICSESYLPLDRVFSTSQ